MWRHLIEETLYVYREIDRKVSLFQVATGLRCPPGCGVCCESPKIEATILECLPLANKICRQKEEDTIMAAIDKAMAADDAKCVLFRSDEAIAGHGRCSYYRHRPLICRLFGFAARRDKFGGQEICLCRVVRDNNREAMKSFSESSTDALMAPIYQDSFMRVSTIHPDLGFRLFPINIALTRALEYLLWKRPRYLRYGKAA